MVLTRFALGLLLLAATSCASARPRVASVDPGRLPTRAPVTVLVFYSPHCHCLTLHDPRVVALYERYHARGVQFFMVDSEVGAAQGADDAEARRRGYPFPMLLDPGARLADQVGAEYSSYSVVLDAEGRIRYRGGIDSDKTHLQADAEPWLADALDDVLAGRATRLAQGKTFGCALRKW
jgi:hypothetical protein